MKLLIAIDGSETALRALHYVVDHPDFFGDNAELLLVFVHLPVPSSRVKTIVGNDVIEQYYKDESEEALGPTRELLAGKAYRATERLIVGQPAAEIIATAGVVVFVDDVPGWLAIGAAALLFALWLSTLLFYAPLHMRLSTGFDAVVHRRLVRTNWIRTVAWTARGAAAVAMIVVAT